jgi:rubrerythrin
LEGWRERAALMSALVLEKAGLDFYSNVSKVAADPRARSLFQQMADRKREEMRLLNLRYGEITGDEAAPTPEEAERILLQGGESVPSIYPMKSVERAVCFVCGEEVAVDALPNECPSCGASRYAFERDIDEGLAFRMAQENEAKCLDLYRRFAEELSGRVKGLLEEMLRGTEDYLRELQSRSR